MTTYTTYTDGYTIVKQSAPRANSIGGPVTVLEGKFDATRRNLAQNDVAEIITIPANTWVIAVFWEVEVVEGASRNFAIGDGGNTSGFVPTTSANSLATGCYNGSSAGAVQALTEGTPNTFTGYSFGRYYPSADTMDLLAVTSGGLTACRVAVKAVCIHLG